MTTRKQPHFDDFLGVMQLNLSDAKLILFHGCSGSGKSTLIETTLTAALKPLQRRGLVTVLPDEKDARARRLTLTDAGRDTLKAALPIWRRTHDAVDQLLQQPDGVALRQDLMALAQPNQSVEGESHNS